MGDGFYEKFMGDGGSNTGGESAGSADTGSTGDAKGSDTGKSGITSDTTPDTTFKIDQGQGSESPTDDSEAKTSGSSADDADADAKKDGKEGSGEGSSTSDDNEKLPFDQHPKWKSARQAEKTMQEIMERNGFEDYDELNDALSSGKSLIELLGNRDAKQLLEESQELQRIKSYWEEQKNKELEENESPEQTNQRLKGENERLRKEFQRAQSDQKAIQESEKTIRNYENTVVDLIDKTDMVETEKIILGNLLGIDNPIDEIDIEDVRAVKKGTQAAINMFQEFVENIRQEAIDNYVKGQGKGPTITKSSGAEGTMKSDKSAVIPKGATTDQVFDNAKKEFLERLEALAKT
jgi:hypothetical protein